MAPTETLAEQHFATIQALMPGEAVPGGAADRLARPRRAAPTRSASSPAASSRLVVGTHALIEPDVALRPARGRGRRRAAPLRRAPARGARRARAPRRPDPARPAHDRHADPAHARARRATATSTDRSCASCPRGRQPIETHVAGGERERERAYERIREELRAGRQAFVVCPLVEESEALQATRRDAPSSSGLRDGEFSDFRVVLLHGQMRPREKQEAMAAFAAGGADVLVATSVIEVGIDVPNATVMLVEDAERYGISQLHQLRGRVGRGEHASLCLLFGPEGLAPA